MDWLRKKFSPKKLKLKNVPHSRHQPKSYMEDVEREWQMEDFLARKKREREQDEYLYGKTKTLYNYLGWECTRLF